MTDTCSTCGTEDVRVFAVGDGTLWCRRCLELTVEAPMDALKAYTETINVNVNFGQGDGLQRA